MVDIIFRNVGDDENGKKKEEKERKKKKKAEKSLALKKLGYCFHRVNR